MNKDYYKILGLNPNATFNDIRKSYHRLAKLYHPDSNGGNLDAAEVFKEVNEAYHTLSDEIKKTEYDLRQNSGFIFHKVDFQPYFIASLETETVKMNDEFEITYRYLGEGRVFKKPVSSALFYNSSPVVNHRMVHTVNGEIKETSMTYTVSALTTGTITIPAASIYINHKFMQSLPLTLTVTPNNCYFKPAEDSANNPYILYLHKEQQGKTVYRRTYIYRHAILIPRSDYVYYYHQVGSTLKITFTVLGFLYSLGAGYSVISGFLLGSLCGGILCHSMYRLTGVHSRFYYVLQNNVVKDYIEEGYKPGREISYWIFDDKYFYQFLSLFR